MSPTANAGSATLSAMGTTANAGNAALLGRRLVAFLAPGRVAVRSVLPTLEWAAELSRREEVAVVSGWQSRMEREVLGLLLGGRCGIVLVLARRPYARLPEQWRGAMDSGRLLIVSTTAAVRQSRQSAAARNEAVCAMAAEVVMPAAPPSDSSLRPLYERLAAGSAPRLRLLHAALSRP